MSAAESFHPPALPDLEAPARPRYLSSRDAVERDRDRVAREERRGASECSEQRADAKKDDAEWFRNWCKSRRISEATLAAILKINPTTAHKKMTGESPVTMTDFRSFPQPHRDVLFAEYFAWCRSADNRHSHR